MSTERFAWAAGILDGEGCIAIYSCKKRKRKDVFYQLYVQIGMRDQWTIKRFADIVGVTHSKTTNRSKPLYHIAIRGAVAERVLVLLMPYLFTKRLQAVIALYFRRSFHGNSQHITDETRALRERCKILIARAKRRPN